jgi:hypothetical protein
MHTNASTDEREWVDARSGRPHLIAALRNDKNRLVMLRTNFRRWSVIEANEHAGYGTE